MSEPRKRKATKKRRAVTTPKSAVEPIATVPVEVTVVFKAHPVSTAPFASYPLPNGASIQIHYRLIAADGSIPIEGWFPYPAKESPVEHAVPTTREVWSNAASIEVFATPYGAGAFLYVTPDPEKERARGRISFNPQTVPLPKQGHLTALVPFQVMESVAQFILGEMITNAGSSIVEQCRVLNAAANAPNDPSASYIEQGARALSARRKKREAQNLFAGKVRTNEGITGTLEGWWLGGDGAWDHKPVIRPIWGTDSRLGDVDYSIYYDIWSNLHYGFVGVAAGFTAQELHEGASQQQRVDSGTEDEKADYDAVQSGCDLRARGGAPTVAALTQIVEAHPGWRSDARKLKTSS